MNIAAHETDKEAAEKGKWFEFDGAKFLIAANGNPRNQKALLRRGKKNRSALEREEIATIEAMTNEVMVDTILLGWEGVNNNGVDYPYTRANALALLNAAQDFRRWVQEQSMNLANFIRQEEASDVDALKSFPALGAPVGEA